MSPIHRLTCMPMIHESEVPEDRIQLAQISVYGGTMNVFYHWSGGHVYVQHDYTVSGSSFWYREQDDSVRSSLGRSRLIDNFSVKNAVIMDGQAGPREVPERFMDMCWSSFVERREVLSFDLDLDPREPESVPVPESEPAPGVEYIPAAELFGY